MTHQQLPQEILYNICQYLDVQDVVDFQEALPEVLQCGIFSDLKKEKLQIREEIKEFHEWILFFYRNREDGKARVINSDDSLHRKIFFSSLWNDIIIDDKTWQDLEVCFYEKERIRREHNLLAKVMNLEEIEEETEECPSCKRRFKETEDILNHLKSEFPYCYEKSHPNFYSIIPVWTMSI